MDFFTNVNNFLILKNYTLKQTIKTPYGMVWLLFMTSTLPSMNQKHDTAAANPGLTLRKLRKDRGWTLSEAGRRAGLPVSTLSKIENGKMSLNYDKLTRLCQALGMDIAEFFAGDASAAPAAVSGRRSITRAGEGHALETSSYFHLYPATDLLNKRFVPIIAELHARTLQEFGKLVRHSGEEYTYVLEGTVDLHTDMYAPTRLEKGDSIYFDSGMAHAYLAVGDGPCRVLSICSASEAQLMEQVSGGAPAQASSVAKPARAKRKTKNA